MGSYTPAFDAPADSRPPKASAKVVMGNSVNLHMSLSSLFRASVLGTGSRWPDRADFPER